MNQNRKPMLVKVAVGVVASALLLAGIYWLVDPDFTDWEAERLACLDAADEVERPAQVEACRKTIAEGPFSGTELGDIYAVRALLRTQSGRPRPETVIGDLENALSHGTTDVDSLYAVADWLYDESDAPFAPRTAMTRASIDAIDVALGLAPDRHDLRYLRARVLWWVGDGAGALAALEEVRPAYAEDLDFLSLLGEAYLAEDQPQRAIETTNLMLSLEPQDVPSLFLRARAAMVAGDYRQTIDDLSFLQQALPTDVGLVFLDVLAHCALDDVETARQLVRASVAGGVVSEEAWYDELTALDAVEGLDVAEAGPEGPDVIAVVDAWIGAGCPQSAYPLP